MLFHITSNQLQNDSGIQLHAITVLKEYLRCWMRECGERYSIKEASTLDSANVHNRGVLLLATMCSFGTM